MSVSSDCFFSLRHAQRSESFWRLMAQNAWNHESVSNRSTIVVVTTVLRIAARDKNSSDKRDRLFAAYVTFSTVRTDMAEPLRK